MKDISKKKLEFDLSELRHQFSELSKSKSLIEEVIRDAQEFAENIIDTIRTPLLVLDTDLRVIRASRSFYEGFKVDSKHTEGQLIHDLGNGQWDIPSLRLLLEDIIPQSSEIADYKVDHDFETIGVRTMLIDARKVNRKAFKSELILISIEDITERIKTEKHLAETNSLRELLLDIITHDIRNPAGVIYGMSDLAHAKMPENKLIEHIHSSSQRLIKVLENTSILTQAVFGEKIAKEEIDLKKMLSEQMDENLSALHEAGMDLELNFQDNIFIEANPLISQVFKNFISNAIKYARDGKKILIEAVEEDDAVLISVKDCGVTIPEKERMNVFERKYQIQRGNDKGRGLGLAIVKRIATAHDGEVWVEPHSPRGNSFCIRIPRQKD